MNFGVKRPNSYKMQQNLKLFKSVFEQTNLSTKNIVSVNTYYNVHSNLNLFEIIIYEKIFKLDVTTISFLLN